MLDIDLYISIMTPHGTLTYLEAGERKLLISMSIFLIYFNNLEVHIGMY